MAKLREIGKAALNSIDDGMGVAIGEFLPSSDYAVVRDVFRRLSEACHTRAVESNLWRERDELGLRILNPSGTELLVDWVMIYDFDVDSEFEIHVKVLDIDQWRRSSNLSRA